MVDLVAVGADGTSIGDSVTCKTIAAGDWTAIVIAVNVVKVVALGALLKDSETLNALVDVNWLAAIVDDVVQWIALSAFVVVGIVVCAVWTVA